MLMRRRWHRQTLVDRLRGLRFISALLPRAPLIDHSALRFPSPSFFACANFGFLSLKARLATAEAAMAMAMSHGISLSPIKLLWHVDVVFLACVQPPCPRIRETQRISERQTFLRIHHRPPRRRRFDDEPRNPFLPKPPTALVTSQTSRRPRTRTQRVG